MLEVVKSFVNRVRNEMLIMSDYNYSDIVSNDISSIRLANITSTNMADFNSQNLFYTENTIKNETRENISIEIEPTKKPAFTSSIQAKLSSIREEESHRFPSAKVVSEDKKDIDILETYNDNIESTRKSSAKSNIKTTSEKRTLNTLETLKRYHLHLICK